METTMSRQILNMSNQPDHYQLLSELKPQKHACVLGVIVSYKEPSPTRGSDSFASVVIVDPTKPDATNGFLINIFRRLPEQFPDIRCCGEILAVECLTIQTHGDKLQGLSNWRTSFMVFSGEVGSSFKPRACDPRGKCYPIVSNRHECLVRELREWWSSEPANPLSKSSIDVEEPSKITLFTSDTEDIVSKENANPKDGAQNLKKPSRPWLKISEIRLGVIFELVCQIVQIDYIDFAKPNMNFIRVTDFTSNALLESIETYQLGPIELESSQVLQVVFWDDNAEISRSFREGQYIKLSGVKAKYSKNGGMVEAVLHGNRGPGRKDMTVEVLDATHPLIKDLNRRRAELLRKQLPSRAEDIRRAVTDIAHPSQIVTSIKSVLESETVPNKYRLKVKLMAFQPTNLQEFTRPFCKPCQQSFPPSPNPPESCPTCKQLLNDQAYIFMFSILVTDDSGEYLPIIIHGDEATQFLRGLKPTNLYNDSRGLQKLGRYLSKLFNQSTNTTPESSASSFTSSTSSFTDNNINAHLLQSVDHELGQSGNNNDETDNIHDDEAVSFSGANRWFDVCVVSYRVPGKEGGTREGEDERDWVVRYKLFGTSIVN